MRFLFRARLLRAILPSARSSPCATTPSHAGRPTHHVTAERACTSPGSSLSAGRAAPEAHAHTHTHTHNLHTHKTLLHPSSSSSFEQHQACSLRTATRTCTGRPATRWSLHPRRTCKRVTGLSLLTCPTTSRRPTPCTRRRACSRWACTTTPTARCARA